MMPAFSAVLDVHHVFIGKCNGDDTGKTSIGNACKEPKFAGKKLVECKKKCNSKLALTCSKSGKFTWKVIESRTCSKKSVYVGSCGDENQNTGYQKLDDACASGRWNQKTLYQCDNGKVKGRMYCQQRNLNAPKHAIFFDKCGGNRVESTNSNNLDKACKGHAGRTLYECKADCAKRGGGVIGSVCTKSVWKIAKAMVCTNGGGAKLEGCTPEEAEKISSAYVKAKKKIGRLEGDIETVLSEGKLTKKLKNRVKKALKKVRKIKNSLNQKSKNFVCYDSVKGRCGGHSAQAGAKNIAFCPSYFGNSGSIDTRSSTLIHEFAHMTGIINFGGERYFGNLGDYPRDYKNHNWESIADSYDWWSKHKFCLPNKGGKFGCKEVTERVRTNKARVEVARSHSFFYGKCGGELTRAASFNSIKRACKDHEKRTVYECEQLCSKWKFDSDGVRTCAPKDRNWKTIRFMSCDPEKQIRFNICSKGQKSKIVKSFSKARELLKKVKSQLFKVKNVNYTSRIKKQVKSASRKTAKILSKLKSKGKELICYQNSGAKCGGHLAEVGAKDITFCPDFFKLDLKKKAGILIHELAHKAGMKEEVVKFQGARNPPENTSGKGFEQIPDSYRWWAINQLCVPTKEGCLSVKDSLKLNKKEKSQSTDEEIALEEEEAQESSTRTKTARLSKKSKSTRSKTRAAKKTTSKKSSKSKTKSRVSSKSKKTKSTKKEDKKIPKKCPNKRPRLNKKGECVECIKGKKWNKKEKKCVKK